eukprot:7998-Heterococcus_DN1.PRE.3
MTILRYILPLLAVIAAACSYKALSSHSNLIEDARTALECSVCKTTQLTGTVDDCCIDFRTVDLATRDYFLPLLRSLQQSTFFKYFKVDLSKDCPFWHEDGQCVERACALDECDPKDIPRQWLEQDIVTDKSSRIRQFARAAGLVGKSAEQLEKECEHSAVVEKELGVIDHSHSDPQADSFNPWDEMASLSNVWTEQEEQEENMDACLASMSQLHRVADVQFVYYETSSQSLRCVDCGTNGANTTPLDMHVYCSKWLMSGLQSSITTQIAADYHFEDDHWGPNIQFFTSAVGAHPDRLTNLYFAYLFCLRALAKAAPLLQQYDYSTGNAAADNVTAALMRGLVKCEPSLLLDANLLESGISVAVNRNATTASAQCMRGFDEKGMFEVSIDGPPQSEEAYQLELRANADLKDQFIHKFQNISRIMDCVGCEKCKMWGKLETLGIGTAIKIILASESDEEVQALSRNEVIALVNTAAQLAKSVGSVPHWKALELQQYAKKVAKYSAAAVSALLVLVYLLKRALASRKRPSQQRARVGGTTTTSVSKITVVRPAAAVSGNGSSSTTTAASTRPKEE